MPRRNRKTPPQKQPEFENPDSGKRIELTRGLYALVSPDDYEFLSQFNWMAVPDRAVEGKFYALIPSSKYSPTLTFGSIWIHQVVWKKNGLPKCHYVYHVNNNGLDNRRENLVGEKPGWLLSRLADNYKLSPVRQRNNEQIPIENPDIGRLLTFRNGLVVAVDSEDYDRVSRFTWHVTDDKTDGRTTIKANINGKYRSISQVVMNWDSPQTSFYYSNKNPFDNRKKNIHIVPLKNTEQLTSVGIEWVTQRKCYSFRFLSPNGKLTEYFASSILDDVIEFKNELFSQMSNERIFCLKCRRFLDIDDFEGVMCKDCFTKSVLGKHLVARDRRMDRGKLREEKQKIYTEHRDKPCTDCKKSFPYQIMHFHHIDRTQKKFEIPILMGSSRYTLEQLLSEINKCVVLCPNCHLEREWGVNGSLRQHFKKKYSTGQWF